MGQGLPVPIPAAAVVEHAGGGDGIFRGLFPTEEIAQQVRHKQQGLGGRKGPVPLPLAAVELIGGVVVHGVDARTLEQGPLGDDAVHRLHILVRGVPIAPGQAQQVAVFVQQPIIHPPGVDAQAVEGPLIQSGKLGQRPFHVGKDRRRVPIEDAVEIHAGGLKAVQLLHLQPFPVEAAQDRPAVAGAQVKGQQVAFCHMLLPC